MKSFKTHISEETVKTLCDMLSGSETEFVKFMNKFYALRSFRERYDESAMHFKTALVTWFTQEGGKKDTVLSYIKPALECKRRADWTYYTGGFAYRGVYKSLRDAGFKASPIITNNRRYLIGEAIYTSIYPMQSWTTDFDVADHFSALPRGTTSQRFAMKSTKTNPLFGFIYEIKLPKEQTLFNPETVDKLSVANGKESEVIRTVNTPVKAKVYLHINYIKVALSECLSIDDLKDEAKVTKVLVGWFGETVANALVKQTSILRVQDRD